MKKTYVLLLLAALFTSCAPKKVSETKFSLSIDSLVGASATANFQGGLIIYGKASNGDAFGRIVTVDNLKENLPNGNWNFYLIGWDDNAGQKLSGKVYCGKAIGINLEGSPTIVNVDMANGNCADSIWGPSFFDGVTNNIKFISSNGNFRIHSCNEKGFTNVTGSASQCEYNPVPGSTNYRNGQGFAQNYQVIIRSFDQFGGVLKFNSDSYSSLVTAVTRPSTGYYANITNMNFPLGGSLHAPFVVEIQAYYDTQASNKGYKSFILKNGLMANNNQVKAYFDATNNLFDMFTKVGESDVCQEPRLSAAGFPAGNGGVFPFVICNEDQLQLASDNSESNGGYNYILAKDIDLVAYFDASDMNLLRYKDDPMATFTPFGYNSTNSPTIFTGVFDGAGHYIRNMFIAHTGLGGIGFIASLGTGGKVLNTKFDNLKISGESSSDNVGGIAGKSNGIIDNIVIKDLELSGKDFIGGVVGLQDDPTAAITRVLINRLKIKGYNSLGGFIGLRNMGSMVSSSIIEGLYIDSQQFSNPIYVGAVVGNNISASSLSSVVVYGTLDMSDDAVSLGGLCGNNSCSASVGITNVFVYERSMSALTSASAMPNCGGENTINCLNIIFPAIVTESLCGQIWNGTSTYKTFATQIAEGRGFSATNPIIVCNGTEFQTYLAGATVATPKYFKLGQTIRLSPASTIANVYDVIDGNGYSLMIDGAVTTTANNYIFGNINAGAAFKNISFITSQSGGSGPGIRALINSNAGVLKNILVLNQQTISAATSSVAAFVENNNAHMENIIVKGGINFTTSYSGTSLAGGVSNNNSNGVINGMSVGNSMNTTYPLNSVILGGVVASNSGVIDQAHYKGNMMFSSTGNTFNGGGIVGENLTSGIMTNVMTETYSNIEVNNSANTAHFSGLAGTNNGSINFGISMMSMKFVSNITNMYPVARQGTGSITNVYSDVFAKIVTSGWSGITSCSHNGTNLNIVLSNSVTIGLNEVIRVHSNDAILDIPGTNSPLSSYSAPSVNVDSCDMVSRRALLAGGDNLSVIENVNSYSAWDIGFLNMSGGTIDMNGVRTLDVIEYFAAEALKQPIPANTPVWTRHNDRKIPRLLRFEK